MKHILNTLAFYASNPGLQSFSKTCHATRRAVKSLESKGYLTVFWESNQAKFTGNFCGNFNEINPYEIIIQNN